MASTRPGAGRGREVVARRDACEHGAVSGLLCLQGGRELTPPCAEMDAAVLRRARVRRVAVLAGAARVGDDYDGASQRARRHYEELGATVAVVPDPRVDRDAALDALDDDVQLLVLPGGSPSSLLDVVAGDVGRRVRHLQHEGTAISGASAGAMVLCQRVVRPDRGDVVDGLGLVEGLALPHWEPGSADRWDVPAGITWGLPECGGVLIDGTSCEAIGRGSPSVRAGGDWQPLERSSRPGGTDPR